jgi:orotate phosphoribosyltransferase
MWSPFYVQLRPLVSKPKLLGGIGQALANLIARECPGVNRVVGVAMAGIPIAVATSLSSGIPAAYTRKVARSSDSPRSTYGEHSLIEGELQDGDMVAVIDDVVTRFDSKLEAIAQLESEANRLNIRISCHDVCVVVNRLQTTIPAGINLHSLVQLTPEKLETLKSYLLTREYEVIDRYLKDPQSFQNADIQNELSQQVEAN